MKKFLLLVIVLVSVCLQLGAGVCLRRATLGDVGQLMGLYARIDNEHDARRALVTYPIQIRERVVIGAIEHERLFVAVDRNTGQIVSFLKMFCPQGDELVSILRDELRFDPTQEPAFLYLIKCMGDRVLVGARLLMSAQALGAVCGGTNDCLYCYYGGAYTIPECRGQRIQTELIRFGLSNVCLPALTNGAFRCLALVYGQVDNTHQQMIRAFARFLGELGLGDAEQSVCLQHVGYRAIKPELSFVGGRVVPVFKDENAGFGNMLVALLSGRRSGDDGAC